MSTVKMIHEQSGRTADVHKNEVENYKAGGYVEAPKPKRKPAKSKEA